MSDWAMRVYQKSCEDMSEIPDRSIQTCVTSPPYYGLRDYGTGRWDGGDSSCDHVKNAGTVAASVAASTLEGGKDSVEASHVYRSTCARCGAKRVDEQIGLEETVDEFVERLVAVFREVRRVLRDDGTLWVNLGDSYASRGTRMGNRHGALGEDRRDDHSAIGYRPLAAGFKENDLIGVPWRVAFALQADGWYLRSDIIWHKPNPMPSSVTDRCTSAHEYIFMLSKRARYFFDGDAIREPLATATLERISQAKWKSGEQAGSDRGHAGAKANGPMRAVVNAKGAARAPQLEDAIERYDEGGANKRDVWTIGTEAYSEAHFATFPRELPSLCIRAGSSEAGCCSACGASRARVRTAAGFEPSCECDAPTIASVVLDPFMGSGTTAEVAESLGRRWVGYELNPEYHKLIAARTRQTGLFAI